MVYGRIFSELKARFKALGQQPGTAPGQKLSAADQELVVNILAGVRAQVVHEQQMETARGREPVSVRLVPQIPVRDRKGAAAWIGGGARLPAGVEWPMIDGSALQLLAQFECARLPAGLWNGLGPRRGSLAIFLHPQTLEAKVLHFSAPGDFVTAPPILENCNIVGYDGSKRAESSGFSWTFSRWPVDIVPVVHGRNDPRIQGRSQIRHQRYGFRHDFVTEQRWPFDWATAQIMIGTALAAYESAIPKKAAGHLKREALAKFEQAIFDAEKAGEVDDVLVRKRINLDEYRAMAAVHEFASMHGADIVNHLRVLKGQVDVMAADQAFSAKAIAPILAELKALTWMHKSVPPSYRDGEKLPDAQRFDEGVEVFSLPLTTHDPAAHPNWVHDFETQLLDAAKPVYLRDPAVLPATLIADCEQVWRAEAASETCGIGHVPWGYVHDFDGDTDVTLIEVPSSSLIGWQFGDVYNLVVTLKKADLARNDFSRPLVQITN